MQVDVDFRPADVIEIAEAAGRAILEVYKSHEDDWGVVVKSDHSPLTDADSKANALICSELARIAPHVPIVSEETKLVPYSVRKGYQLWWCVDPLDGTKEFIKRNGQFTVNIALVKGDRPILGVVHTPCLKKTHWAVAGKGAFLRDHSSQSDSSAPPEDKPIRAAEYSDADPGLVIMGSLSHSTPETEKFIGQFKEPKVEAMGSSLKFMRVAEGSAHVYPRLAPTSEWDTCASQIIVEEAGGKVLQWPSQEPVVYRKENILNPHFVVFGARKEAQ
ncbi:hypothetical protein CLOM_g3635 [Closterium sp. NIES-68]|nr:hypothetical protein CLOM_g3635 [Closterium sp. NIES-68]GJP76969.1 hypothetical protein CLOP_g7409 [Closterium sp. NIES-67]GJP82865.1 hypothetical protein CLOP_g13092 [Closterium sp. NIES-67]